MVSRISAEKVYTHADTEVIYKTQAGLQDRRHLVVIFSGFCPLGQYNFDGTVANGCRFDILWVKDEFGGNNSYYLSRSMTFDIEDAVISLIDTELERLGLDKFDCTLMGYSKGGTAAIFYGLKYGFRNIVASGPQINFASFARDHFNSSFRHMTTDGSDPEIAELDNLVPELLIQNADFDKNVYIISSSKDQFHESQVVPWLKCFERFDNFNLLMTESDLVSEHKYLGGYNTPLILSLLYALGEGIAPRFHDAIYGGNSRNEGSENRDEYFSVLRKSRQIVLTLDRASMRGGFLYPEGVAFMKGFEQPGFGAKTVTFILKSFNGSHEYILGSYRDAGISSKFFDRYFCNYLGAGYKSIDSTGLDVSKLPDGAYAISAKVEIEGDRKVMTPAIARDQSFSHFHGGKYYFWESSTKGARLVKRNVVDCVNGPDYFALKKFELRDSRIYIEGVFAMRGVSTSNYDRSLYSLILSTSNRTIRIPLAQGSRESISVNFEGGYADHSKAYFATPRYKGIDISHIDAGIYECFVSWHKDGRVFSKRIGHRIESEPDKVLIAVDDSVLNGFRDILKSVSSALSPLRRRSK